MNLKGLKAAIRRMWTEQRPAMLIIVACLMLSIFFTFKSHRVSTNPRSRLITVERLLEAGTFAHYSENDTTPFELSADAVMIDHKLYSSKPPIYPTMMAIQSWPLKLITGWNFYERQKDFVRYLVIINQVLPYAAMLLVVLFLGMQMTEDRWTLAFLTAGMSIGLLPFAYVPVINNHVPAAIMLMVAYAVFYFIRHKGWESNGAFFGFGLLAGMAGMFDLPGLAFVAIFTGLLALHRPRKTWLVLAGITVPILISISLFYGISGSPLPFYLQKGLYNYEGSFLAEDRAIRTFTEPRLNYLFHSILGHHGILTMSPVILIGIIGLVSGVVKKEASRMEFAGIGLFVLAVLVFVVSRTYNYGGWCMGMRWYILFMPLLMFCGIRIVEKLAQNWPGRIALTILIAGALSHMYEAGMTTAFKRGSWDLWWESMLQ